jgi:hypothetical protein
MTQRVFVTLDQEVDHVLDPVFHTRVDVLSDTLRVKIEDLVLGMHSAMKVKEFQCRQFKVG